LIRFMPFVVLKGTCADVALIGIAKRTRASPMVS